MPSWRSVIRRALAARGLEVTRTGTPEAERTWVARAAADAGRRRELVRALLTPFEAAMTSGAAKDGQDLVVVWLTSGAPGFFVEVGAQDGVRKSNALVLERLFGWSGICVEANPDALPALRRNRHAVIDPRALHVASGTRTFAAVLTDGRGGESQLLEYRDPASDLAAKEVEVETVSLADLLAAHGAPERIDYLSVDIEGGEVDALSDLRSLRHRFSFITCEHGFRADRSTLRSLIESAGYRIVLERYSRNEYWAIDESGPFAARFDPDGEPWGRVG